MDIPESLRDIPVSTQLALFFFFFSTDIPSFLGKQQHIHMRKVFHRFQFLTLANLPVKLEVIKLIILNIKINRYDLVQISCLYGGQKN